MSATGLSLKSSSAVGDFVQRHRSILALCAVFVLLCLVLSQLSDRFLTRDNITNVLSQSAINGIISVGMTFVILTAGIDLSVGSILALSSVIAAGTLQAGAPVPLAVVVGLGVGAVLGMINGVVITRWRGSASLAILGLSVGAVVLVVLWQADVGPLAAIGGAVAVAALAAGALFVAAQVNVPPFVATLGMMAVARGLALTYTQGRPITGLPESFRFISKGGLGFLRMPVIVAAAVFVVGWIVLNRMRAGQNIVAVGNNPIAARFAGIAVDRTTAFVYVVAGFLSALAGLILAARLNSAQPTAGLAYEFDAIAAVVVGGTSFAGGLGGVGGTLLGVLIIGVLNNGLNLLDIPSFYQPVVTGVVIALALLLYRLVR